MAAEAYIWYFEQAMSRLTQPTGMIAGRDDPVYFQLPPVCEHIIFAVSTGIGP